MPIPAGPTPGSTFIPGTVLQPRFAVIGDLILGGVDDYGSAVFLNDLSGWDGATGTTLSSEQRVADDGAWLSDAYLPARMIEATITVSGLGFEAASASLGRLVALVPDRAPAEMVVTNHGTQLAADVIQSGDILSSQKGHVAKLSIPLEAPDPRRYGVDVVTLATGLPVSSGGLRAAFRLPIRVLGTVLAGSIQAVNEGTVSTRPTFTVYGPCPAFTITHRATARVLRYHEDVPVGHHVVIDVASRTALLDGVAPRYVTGSWFEYAPGVNDIAFSAATHDPGALLVSEHRNAWK